MSMLAIYLELRREVEECEHVGDLHGADVARDAMDDVWYVLGDDEREALDYA